MKPLRKQQNGVVKTSIFGHYVVLASLDHEITS